MKKSVLFIKRWILQGIIVTLPLLLTLFVLYYGIIYTDAILWFLWDLIPWDLLPWAITKPNFPGLGLVVFATLLVIIGMLTEHFIVGKIVNIFNYLMGKLPIIRNIYTTTEQVVKTLLGNKQSFQKVVIIEFPIAGVYALAFKTSDTSKNVCDQMGIKLVNVFIPTTPTPTSGFYLMVPENKITPTNLSAEEAIKLIISAGIVQN